LEDSKDAMDAIKEQIEQKVEDVIIDKVEELAAPAADAADKVADWVETKTEKASEEVAAKVDEALKPVTDVIAKLEENPEVKKAIDAVVAQVDGRMFTCWCCCGFDLTLRISRRVPKTSLAKQPDLQSVALPVVQSTQPVESSPPKVEVPSSEPPAEESKTVSV
jgi:hypothetical protein